MRPGPVHKLHEPSIHTATVDWPATTATDYLTLCSRCTEKRQIGPLTVEWIAPERTSWHKRHGSCPCGRRSALGAHRATRAAIAAPAQVGCLQDLLCTRHTGATAHSTHQCGRVGEEEKWVSKRGRCGQHAVFIDRPRGEVGDGLTTRRLQQAPRTADGAFHMHEAHRTPATAGTSPCPVRVWMRWRPRL